MSVEQRMGFSYSHEGERSTLHFTCGCGSKRVERVTVKRPSGSVYETEFAKCYECLTMYHWPGLLPTFMPSGGVPMTYGASMGPPSPLSAEAYQDIMGKAAAAQRRRRRR